MRLKKFRSALKRWSKTIKHPDVIVAKCNEVILFLDSLEELRSLSDPEFLLCSLVHSCLSLHLKRTAAFWRRQGKIRFCVLGDQNTKFFHACASVRRRGNQIACLVRDSVEHRAHNDKACILRDFYLNLLGTKTLVEDSLDLHQLMAGDRLDSAQSAALDRPFSTAEIKASVFGMRAGTAPGLDGFGPAFFKHAWTLLASDLQGLAEDFFDHNAELSGINRSYITLIPKVDAPTSPSNF